MAGVAAVGGAFAARRVRLAAGADVRGGHGAARAVRSLPHAVVRGLGRLVAALAGRPDGAGVRRVRLTPGTDPAWAGVLIGASAESAYDRSAYQDLALVLAVLAPAGTLVFTRFVAGRPHDRQAG
ncbi:monovalent cation/H+ antiporter complex subunit F [Streptomyces sp. NPDC056367]|uniref:monovalent cation/H+ antiporter complex subunit F n=1 Tax=Streptomyces sp. NPDC056367 TaxID=3345797 RepID=UPI0035D79A7C